MAALKTISSRISMATFQRRRFSSIEYIVRKSKDLEAAKGMTYQSARAVVDFLNESVEKSGKQIQKQHSLDCDYEIEKTKMYVDIKMLEIEKMKTEFHLMVKTRESEISRLLANNQTNETLCIHEHRSLVSTSKYEIAKYCIGALISVSVAAVTVASRILL